MNEFDRASEALAKFDTRELVSLISSNKSLVSISGDSKQTLLVYACVVGNLNAIKVLLDFGADKNIQDETGNTPLIEACLHGHSQVVSMLIEVGANVNLKNDDGETALTSAIVCSHAGIARLLIENGSNVNCKTNIGETPLTLAVQDSLTNVARYLIENGADTNYTVGTTSVLKLAIKSGSIRIIRLIVSSRQLSPINNNEIVELMNLIDSNTDEAKRLIDQIYS